MQNGSIFAKFIREGLKAKIKEDPTVWVINQEPTTKLVRASIIGIILIGKYGLSKAIKIFENVENDPSTEGQAQKVVRICKRIELDLEQANWLAQEHKGQSAARIAIGIENGLMYIPADAA